MREKVFYEKLKCHQNFIFAGNVLEIWLSRLNYSQGIVQRASKYIAKLGEMYSQALEETGFTYQTLADDKWVTGQIELSLRKDNLSFSHHREVASLPRFERDWP